MARMDEFVKRVFGDRIMAEDSTELIREEREKRTRELMQALSGDNG
jgi:hypothetical protein